MDIRVTCVSDSPLSLHEVLTDTIKTC
jgi:hypothetical protein